MIFDLDLTIFDSTPIADLMTKKDWKAVYENIHLCNFYDNSINVINHLKNFGVKVIIFTNAPKTYVTEVLNFGLLDVDDIIAYRDTERHKPDPQGIYKIMRTFCLSNKEIIYIGDSNLDFECASNARVGYFNVEWGNLRTSNVQLITFKNFFKVLHENNYLSHIPINFLPNEEDESLALNDNLLKRELNKYFLGYYRHDKDGIKRKVIDFKEGDLEVVDQWLRVILQHINYFPNIDYIVRALGHNELKAEKSSLDKVGLLLEQHMESASYIPELLEKKSTNDKLTSMSATSRKKTLSKQYYINDQNENFSKNKKTFLIIDDVYTSGNTTKEITRAIRESIPNSFIYIYLHLSKPKFLMIRTI